MNAQGVLGIVLIGVGIALLVFGWNASQSLVDQVSETFTGRFTDETMWYFIGGAAAAVAGVVMIAGSRRR